VASGKHERRSLDGDALARAKQVIKLAWSDLPRADQLLLENVGADRWEVVDSPLGRFADDLLHSASHGRMTASQRNSLDQALGVWVHGLNVVLIDAGNREYAGLDQRSYEAALVRVAWHEWAHALGVARATADDVAAGPRLLGLAPDGVRDGIRSAGYRRHQYTHELIAEIYALLMARRRRGQVGQPPWLEEELYELVRRVCGWSQ